MLASTRIYHAIKRTLWLILAVLILFVLAVLVLLKTDSNRGAPRFVPGTPASISPFRWNHYNWSADAPFEDDKVWLWTVNGTNHTYLYDLDRRVILGELFNASLPELRSRDGSRLLVEGHYSPSTSLKEEAMKAINSVCGLFRLKPITARNRTETFWVLDITDNSATRVGSVAQIVGTGSSWHPSPDFRHGYTTPTTSYGSSFVLCDLKDKVITHVPASGRLIGWWDDSHILIKSAPKDFILFDIVTRTSRVLFSPADIDAFLAGAGLPNDPAGLAAGAVWNGSNYDFYFGIEGKTEGLGDSDSFLLKADRAGPALKLAYPHFRFKWGGHLDLKGTHYLYQGESGFPGEGGNGAVYLRNLIDGTTVTIVPPDNKGQYAIPRFYGKEVIYFRDRIMHRIQLNGSNDAPVLLVGEK